MVSVLREVPVLGRLLTSLYDCDYSGFMHALVDITPDLTRDRCVRGLHASRGGVLLAALLAYYPCIHIH